MNKPFDSKKETLEIITHLVIAVFCLPLYQFGGEVFKFLLAPYVIYMLFRMQPKYIPALLIHFMDGTSMSFLILMGCLIITIKNIKRLKQLKLRFILILILLPMPLFIYNVYLKVLSGNESLISIIRFLFLYLGLFSFFYFLLMARKFKRIHLKYIFIVLGFAVVLNILSPTTVRYIFFSLPVFVTLLFISLKKRSFYDPLFVSSLIMVLLLTLGGTTSTLFFTAIIGAFIAMYYSKRKVLTKRIVYLLFAATSLLVVVSVFSYNPSSQKLLNYDLANEELDVLDPNSIFKRAQFKLFEDRSPLWYSVYDNYVINGKFSIPIQQNEFTYYTVQGTEIESDLPAHNIYLELIKKYGIFTGLVLSLVFILMIIKSSLILKIKNLNIYLIVISASIISCGFFGGMTGQYLLLGTFSFLFMGLAGLCYGIYINHQQDALNKKFV